MAAAATVAAALAWPLGCRPRVLPTRIVLVTLDTLRYDSVFGGSGRASTMPLLLARARRGLVFERFYSSTSSTQPTHASLFTGLHPWQHGVTRNSLTLGDEHTTVAEALKTAGFSTAAVIASYPVTRRFGFGQGFDVFDEQLTDGQLGPAWDVADPEERFYRLAEPVTERALAQIEAGRGDKQFYWFHYFDAHTPYGDAAGAQPTLRPYDVLNRLREGIDVKAGVSRLRELYDQDSRHLDQSLDRVFRRLDADADRFETHVIVTADHGESFGEDGSLAHGRRVTPGQIHVPFFILSRRLPAGVRSDVGGSVDLPSTLYALAGIGAKAPGGRDLLVAGKGGGAFGMRRTFTTVLREIRLDGRAYRLDFKLFYAVGNDGRIHAGNGNEILPGEGTGDPGPAAQPLQTLFRSFERQLEGSERPRNTDPEVERALKALGYVG